MLVFCGDLHCGSSLRARSPQLAGDWARALKAMLAEILALHGEHGVEAVVLPGDVFHRESISGEEIAAFGAFAATLRSAGVRLLAIQGNHDYGGEHPLFAPLGAEDLDGRTVVLGDVAVHGIGHRTDQAEFKCLVAECPPCDILVVHTGFDWNLGFKGASALCNDEIPAHVGLALAGHVHKDGRRGRMVSLSSMVPTSFAEGDARYIWTYGAGTLSKREIPSRAISIVDVACEADLADLDDEITELSRAMASGGMRGRLGAALLARATPAMAAAVASREETSGGVLLVRGVLAADSALEPSCEGGGGAVLADAIPALLAGELVEIREAAAAICSGVQARAAAAELRRRLVARHVG